MSGEWSDEATCHSRVRGVLGNAGRRLGGRGGFPEHHPGQEQLGERADRHRVEHGADPDGAAEQPADGQHGQLDPGAHPAHRPPGTGVQPGHQPVPGAGAETRADVTGGGQPVEQHPGDHQGDLPAEPGGRWDHRQRHVDRNGDHHHIGHRAHPGALPQRDPDQQHHNAGERGDRSETPAEPRRQSLVQDVPRVQSELRPYQERHAHAVEHQADEQLGEAGERPAGQADRREIQLVGSTHNTKF